MKCETCEYLDKGWNDVPCLVCDENPRSDGSRREDSATAPKNNVREGKSRITLLPMDVLIKYLIPAYEEGVIKYERESWRGGFHTSVLVDAALRHICDFYWSGNDADKDSVTKKHHLAGAIFSLISILHTLDTRPELDDRQELKQGGQDELFGNEGKARCPGRGTCS